MIKGVNEIKLMFFILIMTACSSASGLISSSDAKVGPSPSVVIHSTRVKVVEFQLEMLQTPLPVLTPKSPESTLPSGGSRRYRIGQRSHTDQGSMQDLDLVLHSAELSASELSLHIGFENTTNQAFSIIGHFNKENVVLLDGAGYGYEPLKISENLQKISPVDGFAPGEANVGNIIFPRPSGGEPYELRLSRFAPIQFRLNSPLPDETSVKFADYPLEVSLKSTQESLAPLELRVHSVRIEANYVTFSVGFVNITSQEYQLAENLIGGDAQLRDAEGAHYKPVIVSASLQHSIISGQGWKPGQEQAGKLIFPKPEAISEVSFIFPGYNKLIIRFDETGIAEVATDMTHSN